MKITTVTLQKNYRVSMEDKFLMDTISAIGVLDEGETALDGIKALKQELDSAHKNIYPNMYAIQIQREPPPQDQSGTTVKIIEQPIAAPSSEPPKKITQKETEESIIQQLQECTEIPKNKLGTGLENYKMFVKGKPKLQAAYDEKLKSLNK